MSAKTGGGSWNSPPRFEESTQLHCFSSENDKNHSFCVEFAEVFYFVIQKKNLVQQLPKNRFEVLSLQRFFI